MYCQKCGTLLTSKTKVCEKCGNITEVKQSLPFTISKTFFANIFYLIVYRYVYYDVGIFFIRLCPQKSINRKLVILAQEESIIINLLIIVAFISLLGLIILSLVKSVDKYKKLYSTINLLNAVSLILIVIVEYIKSTMEINNSFIGSYWTEEEIDRSFEIMSQYTVDFRIGALILILLSIFSLITNLNNRKDNVNVIK